MERGVPIRSISRCIAVLQALNRHGSLSLMDIARLSGLPYPTTCRIVQTLMLEGLVECERTRKCYRVTGLVHTLSQGFNNHDKLVTGARPHIVALTRKVGWPVAITTRVGQSMIVRDTTHDLTSLTFSLYQPGYTMPLLECASGQVYLAHLDEDERQVVIEGLEQLEHRSPLLPLFKSERTISNIRENGFATYERNPHSANPGKTSSIGIPLYDNDHLAGTLTLVFFSSSMAMTEALKRYLIDMQKAAVQITEAISAAPEVPAANVSPLPRRPNQPAPQRIQATA